MQQVAFTVCTEGTIGFYRLKILNLQARVTGHPSGHLLATSRFPVH